MDTQYMILLFALEEFAPFKVGRRKWFDFDDEVYYTRDGTTNLPIW